MSGSIGLIGWAIPRVLLTLAEREIFTDMCFLDHVILATYGYIANLGLVDIELGEGSIFWSYIYAVTKPICSIIFYLMVVPKHYIFKASH